MIIKKFLICFLVICLCGCTVSEDKNEENNQEILYSFEQSTNLTNNQYIESSINFDYNFNNNGTSITYGLMIFIDGYIQEFRLNNSSNNFFQIISSSENTSTKYSITIDNPIVNAQSKNHTINIAGILNPAKKYELNNYNIEHSLSQTINYSIQGNFKRRYSIDDFKCILPKNNLNDSMLSELNIEKKQLNQEIFFEFIQSNKKIIDTINKKNNLDIRIFGKTGKYAIYLFTDGIPYENKPMKIIDVQSNQYNEFNIDLAKYDCKNFFLIACPMNNKDYIYQSAKFVME